jgi:hypothetical protein
VVNDRVKEWVVPWGGLNLVTIENNVYIED